MTPQSIRTTRAPRCPRRAANGSRVATLGTSPLVLARAHELASARFGLVAARASPTASAAQIVPCSRSAIVIARVSAPISAGTRCSSSHDGSRSARGWCDGWWAICLMTVAGDAGAAVLRGAAGDAVVADHRIGERQNLPGIRRIGQRLFVARHAGIRKPPRRARFPRTPSPWPSKRLPSARKSAAGCVHAVTPRLRASIAQLPPTIVASTLRGSVGPQTACTGLSTQTLAGSTVHGRSAKIVTSAGAPTASVPPGDAENARGIGREQLDEAQQRQIREARRRRRRRRSRGR